MKRRPKLKKGEIVKLSKKGKKHSRNFPANESMIVYEVKGDGVDQESIITCRNNKKEFHKFYRSELWSTGRSAFEK